MLSDMKKIFRDELHLKTTEVIRLLTTDNERLEPLLDDDAPWPDLYGKTINSRTLSKYLKPYGIGPTKIRVGSGKNDTFQGYRAEDLHDAWKRYLPPPPAEAEQAEQAEHDVVVMPFSSEKVPSSDQNVPEQRENVPDSQNQSNGQEAAKTLASSKIVPDVPDVPDLRTPVAEGSEYDNFGTEEVHV